MKKACVIATIVFLVLIVASLVLTLFQKSMPLGSKVAIVRLEGPITGSKKLIDEIKGYAGDASVKAIVLRIDSPGGAVAPSQEIYEEVRRTAARKKVVVSMGSIAASGGYYVASPATRIVADPGTLTGSIGVIMEIPNVEGLMDKIGVKTVIIKSGKNKDIGTPFRKMKPEERKILQGVMDNVHDQFIRAVAKGRKMKVEDVRKIADGRIFSGEQAMKIGLVDQLGSLEDAVRTAARLAGISGEPQVVEKTGRFSFFDLLSGKFPRELSDVLPTAKIKYLYSP
ncbi:MAG: signal peptide peptidase SppA [Candidatus Sulfobium sp.]|jgi:protease-4